MQVVRLTQLNVVTVLAAQGRASGALAAVQGITVAIGPRVNAVRIQLIRCQRAHISLLKRTVSNKYGQVLIPKKSS